MAEQKNQELFYKKNVMKRKIKIQTFLLAAIIFVAGCETPENTTGKTTGNTTGNTTGSGNSGSNDGWLIPLDEVFDGGPGKDGIPALNDPEKIDVNHSDNDYLKNGDLVLGIKSGDEITAYPHPILDWHEIINDKAGDLKVAVTYCPLTGTGVGWSRMINNSLSTYGVSGLLYNTNLIPYDRLTGSNWSQIGLQCVNGELIGNIPEIIQLIEMPWELWKQLYPDSKVISSSTGHSRNYGYYPYGGYRTEQGLIFPISRNDNRLPQKERVLGIIINEKVRVYRFESFSNTLETLNVQFEGENLAIIGRKNQYMIAFKTKMEDGTSLIISPSGKEGIFIDQEGNEWNLFGEAVSGQRQAQHLPSVNSFMGYWFSFAAFYPEVSIHP